MTKEIEANLNEVRKAFANVSEYNPDEIGDFLSGVNEAFEVLEKIEIDKRGEIAGKKMRKAVADYLEVEDPNPEETNAQVDEHILEHGSSVAIG